MITPSTTHAPPESECLPRQALLEDQHRRLRTLLSAVYDRNPFYTRKLDDADVHLDTLQLPDDLHTLPLTTKQELTIDQDTSPPWGTAHTEPFDHYTRYSQTSSTTGRPLRWLDTNESWQWTLDCWKAVYRAAHIGASDRIFFPFGFGPFFGFWTAFDAGSQIGALCVPGGGMSSATRLDLLDTVRATVVCCTPTYALRLVEVARATGTIDLAASSVRVVVVAGEPGGNIPATRAQIEQGWGARVIDHHGLTEVGPVSFECWESPGTLHLNEREFICEVVDPSSGTPVPDGETGELVITNLGRTASPVIRYRTRDIVKLRRGTCRCGRTLVRAEGGILSRADDMVCVRGVNIYPTAIEAVVRRFPEVVEYRSTISIHETLHSLTIDVELGPGEADGQDVATRVAQALRKGMGLTVPVRVVAPETLPRFELKARRFVVADESSRRQETRGRRQEE
jgi:phenylacetate-CoA ligase